jgi:adenosylcobinamide-GDP ribazoletransferase
MPRRGAAERAAAIVPELLAAISFLTRLPVRRSAADLDRTGAVAFGLVGTAIGALGAIPLLLVGGRLPLPAVILATVVIVTASGGLHLDGLADTADALAAPTPAAADRARGDPRPGPIGVAALVLDLLLGASLLAAIAASDPWLAAATVVVATTASRAAAPVAAWIERRRGSPPIEGLGGWFTTRVSATDVVAAVVTTALVVVGVAYATDGVIALGAAFGLVGGCAAGALVVVRRGQLDGDGFGAIVEITFVGTLLGIAVAMEQL